ncbi:metallophosphoesterase [Pricia sp. S334]|uniref:Metallophosphoesterase n=1 Tax=Pricia mediterranea TaxID=3076079 RepID=A0ABU3L512_9FLAO|nr:metallophosphoesterase [Pricia sp. S334]MDT7828663.1 metallophosphoesterase [Pricia sp. S334]
MKRINDFSPSLIQGVLKTLIIAITFCTLPVAAQEKYEPPKLDDPDSWTMVILPDPQTYVKFGRNQPILELMTAWISENIDDLNIEMVLCTGDLVEQNEMIDPDGVTGNQTSKGQWESVSNAFSRLDGRVPYITAAGNHDYGYRNIKDRKTNFNRYFPVDKNPKNQQLLRKAAMNAEGVPTLENAAFEFTSPHGREMLFINLEFAPRDTVLAWAKAVVAAEKYKDHTAVILTHSYLNAENEHIVKENYPIEEGNYGRAVYEKLVKPSANIQMVFSGHIGAPDNPKAHVGFRTDRNAAGKKVQQMVFNAQAIGGGWMGNGGDGWLRILEFLPDKRTVKVKTFSPLFAISPTTQKQAWRTADYDEFSFEID